MFTKQEYRQLQGPIASTAATAGSAPVDEGEANEDDLAAGAAGSWASQRKAKKQKTSSSGGGGGSKAQQRPQRGRGKQQQTLDELVSRLTKGR